MNTILFERLGGTAGITAIVDATIEEHMKNPAINARFVPLEEQPEKFASIRQNIIDFFSAGSGGPVTYNGKEMTTAHKGMNINPTEYMSVIDDIMIALDKNNIDEESKKEVLTILWSLKENIISK